MVAHISGKLTKALVRSLGPGRHADGNGLNLVVDPSGARRWVVRVTIKAQKNRAGKPLSLTTRDARLRQVKAFFKWLASQPGYKSRVSFADVEYVDNAAKDARAAHAQRPVAYPSLEQCAHAFRQMPSDTETGRRDPAI